MSVPLPSDSLADWLSWLEHLHPSEIDMGLHRVGQVADRLGVRPARMPVILVGGTNGKGSTVALLSAIYHSAGYRIGAYTSPHIDSFNERMCINERPLEDQHIVDALHTIESAREPETLTYFEYTTLAAMIAFERAECDVVVLEVGLGGRLDATNIWDSDCAILTSIALDHQEYLGNTIEAIAAEKVAIGRPDKPLVVGEPHPPASMLDFAKQQGMNLIQIDDDALPHSALAGDHQRRNAACAIEAVKVLQALLPVEQKHIQSGLENVHVAGRFERINYNQQLVVLDVAHNPAAAVTVRETLLSHYPDYRVLAVFAALKDKDIVGIVSALAPVVSSWYCAELPVPRATPLATMVHQVKQNQDSPVQGFDSVDKAWQAALKDALNTNAVEQPTLILVAGSFYTLQHLRDLVTADDTDSGIPQ